ncbi:MAG: penicillin-binding protein activator [Myxococcota bacterium]
MPTPFTTPLCRQPQTIGMLLPLSGRFQQYEERSAEAIKLAFKSAPEYKLLFKDTQGDPTIASKAVEDLVLDDQVIGLIGSLFSKSATAAALKAEELSVPMLSLSHQDGLPQIGPHIFRTALTPKAQAEALAQVAFEKLGMTRFAILHPRSRYGHEIADAFWDEVDRRKGEIRGIESYEHDETTFREPVRKLVGRWYLLARRAYEDGKWQCRSKKLPAHRRQQCMDDLQKGIAPVVDFEAIVIPDSAKNLGLLAPALAFEDIVMTHDPKELETIKKAMGRNDVHPVTLLGASTWNSQQTVERCERYCENAVFVDGYFPDNPDSNVRDFVSLFREKTGAMPLLSEAQAFDTAGLLKTILQSDAPKDRDKLTQALKDLQNYRGVTGTLRFDKDGDVKRDLYTLTITEGAIHLWTPQTKPSPG